MIQFTTFIPIFRYNYYFHTDIFEVVNLSGRHRGHIGQEINVVKLLQLEVF